MKKFLIFLIIIIMLVGGVVSYDFYKKITTPYKGYDKPITVNIKKGSSATVIAKQLYGHKIISNYYYFRLYYRFFNKAVHFKAGEYLFDTALTMKEVMDKLNQGKIKLYKVTIKEGQSIEETAALLQEQHHIDTVAFIQKARDKSLILDVDSQAPDLEGYLFPDTYHIRKDMDSEEFVEIMVDKFREKFTNSMRWKAEELNMTIREVVTLASLIEKETSVREERFLISSVFHNRLRIGMALACDPTIIFALKRDNVYRGKLGWDELKYDSPYNTRLYRGLPPGPICSPGFASLEAALYPEQTKYLYFVAKDDKSHYFSKSLKEHNQAVRKFIINKKH